MSSFFTCLLGVLALSVASARIAMANEPPIVVAHRGASAYAPENTLPAFELAWEMGADAIEGDFHLTADGEIVCIHDFNIKKYTGVDRPVSEMTLAELRQLDFGAWKGEKWKGVVAPTLGEVLATVPSGKTIYIEIKCGPEIVDALTAQLMASGLESSQVVIISFNEEVVKAIKREMPECVANWLVSIKRRWWGRYEPRLEEARRILRESTADGIGLRRGGFVKSRFVERFSGEGWDVHVWTVDDPEEAKRLVDAGARSITTNKPDEILKALGR